jgi:hypothetical protein
MSYRLRYQQHDFELTPGRFLIGRSSSCQLSVDDPLVSRNHASLTVTDEGVSVEDLGSRNGVRVNGQRVEGSQRLEHGDRVTIGSQEMVFLKQRTHRAETLAQPAPTQRVHAFGVLGPLAEKAIAMGRGDEAERVLGAHLEHVLEDARAGHDPGEETAARAVAYAAKLAATTHKGRWVNFIFELYALSKRLPPADVVDELYAVMRKLDGVDVAAIRDYLAKIRGDAPKMGPAERFLLSRVEGLERLAALR